MAYGVGHRHCPQRRFDSPFVRLAIVPFSVDDTHVAGGTSRDKPIGLRLSAMNASERGQTASRNRSDWK